MIDILHHVDLVELSEVDPFFYRRLTAWKSRCGDCGAVLYGPCGYDPVTAANEVLAVGDSVVCVECGGLHHLAMQGHKARILFNGWQTLSPDALQAFKEAKSA